ncbi:MAG TPA: hypothetical protein VF877_05945 [Gaiellaceae bacterium]
MLDFSKGWTWFVAGLSATVVVTLILFAVVGLAMWRVIALGRARDSSSAA